MTLSLSSQSIRLLFSGITVALAIVLGVFISRTIISDRLLFLTQQPDELDTASQLAGADAATRVAPDISNVRYQRASVYLAQASGEEMAARLKEAINDLREATILSPSDYRNWIALGRALSRHDEIEEARKAFQQAQNLAPNYYETHWAKGNFLFRNGELNSAFAEFKQALIARPTEFSLIFEYAWNSYNGDVPAILKALSPSDAAKPLFATLLISKSKIAEGMQMWRELSASSPAKMRLNARSFIGALMAKQQFGAAFEVWEAASKISSPGGLTEEAAEADMQWYTHNAPDSGSLLHNGGFERDLLVRNAPPFLAWQLTSTKGLGISRDNEQHRSGDYSLRLNFSVPGNQSFIVLEQTIPIQGSAKYRLKFAAKTEGLVTLSAPFIEVFDPSDTKRLHAMSSPLPLNTNAWQDYTIDFTAPTDTQAVVIRITRPACGEPPCPINGKIWLDDFSISKL